MSADITAFILIDNDGSTDEPLFSNSTSTWDLSEDCRLCGCKDYKFYAAISGVRNKSGIESLFPCRGLPPNSSEKIRARIDAADPNVGWLTLTEIHSALEHMKVPIQSLSLSVRLVLRTMQTAEEIFGQGRTRLVFEISD